MKMAGLALLMITVLAAPCMAAASNSLVFQRDTITIEPAAPAADEAAAEDVGEAAQPPPAARQAVTINAQLRSDQALRLEWVHSLSGLSGNEAMMILFDPPAQQDLMPMNIYVPVDVLFVDKQGTITQIAPNLTLAQLQAQIAVAEPLRAWLFLAGGAAERLDIRPRDRLRHPLFSPKPTVIN